MNQHDKNRNLLCNFCVKMYTGLKSLRTHKVVMHLGGQRTTSGKPLKCTICRSEFKMLTKVREHMQKVQKVAKVDSAEILDFE